MTLINKKITVTFNTTNIIDTEGISLITPQLDATIHKFIIDNMLDYFLSFIFKYSDFIFYMTTAILILGFTGGSLHSYILSIFEALCILLLPVRLDYATKLDLKNLMGGLLTFDFFSIIKKSSAPTI